MLKKKLNFFKPDTTNPVEIPLLDVGIKAGFPSPAADFEEQRISLDHYLIKNPETTFFAKANGDSMINASINDGDLLVIDRSLEPKNNAIAVCYIDGEFTVKRIKKTKDKVILQPENDHYKPIEVTSDNNLIIWGIVTFVVKSLT